MYPHVAIVLFGAYSVCNGNQFAASFFNDALGKTENPRVEEVWENKWVRRRPHSNWEVPGSNTTQAEIVSIKLYYNRKKFQEEICCVWMFLVVPWNITLQVLMRKSKSKLEANTSSKSKTQVIRAVLSNPQVNLPIIDVR